MDTNLNLSPPPRFIISGAPASGKGTQCEFIKREYNVVHLSTGDILREAVRQNTDIGIKAKSFMDNGLLVPDDIIIGVIIDRISQPDCISQGWLLDGFPRTKAQADALFAANIICDVFIQLNVLEESLIERIIGRRIDSETGDIYHLKFSPPPQDVIPRLVHRSDDTLENCQARIEAYKNNLDSVIDKYRDMMIQIDGNRSPSLIWEDLRIKCNRQLSYKVIFVLGGPGSGKGTLCQQLSDKLDYVFLSAGDLLRKEASNANSPYKTIIDQVNADGSSVPSDLIVHLLQINMKFHKENTGSSNFLIDGFPRNEENWRVWCETGVRAKVDLVLHLDCDENVMIQRITKRAKLENQRNDDNIDTIKRRLKTFNESTMKVMQTLNRLGKVRKLDASLPMNLVYQNANKLVKGIQVLPTFDRVFLLILPHALSSGYDMDIQRAIVNSNLCIIASKSLNVSLKEAEQFYKFEVNDPKYSKLVETLCSAPAMLLIVEGSEALSIVKEIVGPVNPIEARQLNPKCLRALYGEDEIKNAIYYSKDLFQTSKYLDLFFSDAINDLREEDTFALIKPYTADVYAEDVLSVISAHGFEIISQLRTQLPYPLVREFYSEHVGKEFFERLVEYISSGSVIALHLRRISAITGWRFLIGPTNSTKAKLERPSTIRGIFGIDATRNAVHGSDSSLAVSRELGFFFSFGIFHSPPPLVEGTQSVVLPRSSPSKKLNPLSVSKGDIPAMQSYIYEKIDPIMSNLVSSLIIDRPKNIEEEVIKKLSDLKVEKSLK